MGHSAEDTITISSSYDNHNYDYITDLGSSAITLGNSKSLGGPEYTINISTDAATSGIQSSTITPTLSFDHEARRNILDFTEVEEMCEEYPGLKKVYEKFKHVYDLVKQDWIGKQNEIT